MKETLYKEMWEGEYKAHKFTIEKNIELRATINRLLELNQKLVNTVGEITKHKELLMIELLKLKQKENSTDAS